MEFFYNPDLMSESEIKETFVARHGVVDEIVSLIEHQPKGAGVQHIVIIAPRGMGKTTVLLMIQFAIADRGLGDEWQPVRFPEESYGIYELADLWIEALDLLASATSDATLRKQVEKLKADHPDADDLQEAALAVIKDWSREHKKRLLLLVDNFDIILEQINDERDNARLRDVLMNDGTIMLIGCAVSFFHEARAYDEPLYNFFKIIDLRNLRFEEMQELLRRRAAVDGVNDFDAILNKNRGRIRALEYFTGGNPRLVLMLYRVVMHSDVSDVRRGLERLLDQVTPYYKAKIETLPAQQRKILDHIARASSKTHEGATPGEIASATRLAPNQVSAQLKRLSDDGYVRAANLRVRSSYYTLSEPLYAIWHQMRFGRERMQWLVDFLKAWYDLGELDLERKRLESRFDDSIKGGRFREARDVLEHRRYLAEAFSNSWPIYAATMDGVIRGYADLKDTETLKKELLPRADLCKLSAVTLEKLYETGSIPKEDFEKARALRPTSKVGQTEKEIADAYDLGLTAWSFGKLAEALEQFDRVVEITPDEHEAWSSRGIVLATLGRFQEAILSYECALRIKRDDHAVWNNRGIALRSLGRYEEAISSYDCALEIDLDNDAAWYNRGIALADLGRYEEAISSYDRALEIERSYQTWGNRGSALAKLGRYDEAILSYEHASRINPRDHASWYNRGNALASLRRYDEAISSYDRALEIDPDKFEAWCNRGNALAKLEKHDQAISSYDHALEAQPDSYEVWSNRGMVLADLLRYDEAILSQDRAVEINPGADGAWNNRGFVLATVGRYDEAISSFDRALGINPAAHEAWTNRGIALGRLRRYDEAISSYDRALEIKPEEAAWYHRGDALAKVGRYSDAISSYDRALEINPDKHEAWNNRAVALGRLGRYEEAMSSCDFALRIKHDDVSTLHNRVVASLERFAELAYQDEDSARHYLNEALRFAAQMNTKDCARVLSIIAIFTARIGRLAVAREIIGGMNLGEILFPLARAIDYTLTGDEALIEKLSPEVRGIVDEIVSKLRETAAQGQRANDTRKRKSRARRKTARRLN